MAKASKVDKKLSKKKEEKPAKKVEEESSSEESSSDDSSSEESSSDDDSSDDSSSSSSDEGSDSDSSDEEEVERKRVLVMKAMMKTRRKRAHLVLTKKKRRKKSLLVLTARIPVLPIVLAQRVTAIATPILTPTQKKNFLRNVKLKNPKKKSLLQSRNPKPAASTEEPATLFVGRLSWNIDDAWLKREFEHIGGVIGARVIMERATGKSRGYGYVDFESKSAAEKALEEMQGKEIDGRPINLICLLVSHMHLNLTTIELNSMVTVNLLQVTPYSLVIFPSMLTETICLMFW